MEKNLADKQEQLIKVFKQLTEALPRLQTEEVLRMSFTYVFARETEAAVPPVPKEEKKQDPRIAVLRELRLRSGMGQEKASVAIVKVRTFLLRMESGKAILDKITEKKLLELYKKQAEETAAPTSTPQ